VILDFAILESRLGYSFFDKQLLVDALTHSSYAYEQDVAVRIISGLSFWAMPFSNSS